MPIKSDQFNTVSEELLEAVVTLANNKRSDGYKVTIEPTEIFYPSTPALKLYRRPETIFVELGGKRVPKDRLDGWSAYARSCSADTRICYCTSSRLSDASESWLRKRHIGLIRFVDGQTIGQFAPHDLAVPLGLPAKTSLKVSVRSKLIKVYEKQESGDWRGAFEEACKSLEKACKKYLLRPQVRQRVLIQTSQNRPAVPLDPAKVRRMTLGQLGKTFEIIVGPNQVDSHIGKVINRVTPDRNDIIHANRGGERKLRRNVQKNMLAIIGCMKLL